MKLKKSSKHRDVMVVIFVFVTVKAMGVKQFFKKLWGGVKKTAGKIWGGIKKGAQFVGRVAKKIVSPVVGEEDSFTSSVDR